MHGSRTRCRGSFGVNTAAVPLEAKLHAVDYLVSDGRMCQRGGETGFTIDFWQPSQTNRIFNRHNLHVTVTEVYSRAKNMLTPFPTLL